MKALIKIEKLSAEDYATFKGFYPNHEPVGFMTGGGEHRVILKGHYTPYMTARDCGDHYILARFDRYDRIQKDTSLIIFDVEDE